MPIRLLRWSPRVRLAIVLAAFALHVGIFFFTASRNEISDTGFAVVPVLIAAILFGVRGGLNSSLGTITLHILLFAAIGALSIDRMFHILFPEGLATLAVGAGAGIARDFALARGAEGERWRQLFAATSDAIVLFDAATHRYVDCNAAALRLFGLSRDEFAKLTVLDQSADPAEMQLIIADTIRDGQAFVPLVQIRRRDGTTVPTEATTTTLSRGPRELVMAILRDISARLRADADLRASERRFSAFMRELPGIATIRDAAGRYVFMNPLGERRWRIAPGTAIGKSVDLVLPPEAAARHHALDRRIVETGRAIEAVERIAGTDGVNDAYWLMRRFPIHDEREKVAFVGTVGIDITASRRAAIDAQKSRLAYLTAKAVASAQEVERKRVASDVHDAIGSGLTTLLVELKNLDDDTALPPAAEAHLDDARESVRALIDEAARIGRGLHPRLLDDLGLVATLKQLVGDFRRIHEIEIALFCRGFDGVKIPTEIAIAAFRIVQEALTNVMKHAHATSASVVVEGGQNEIRLTVEDNGRGFDVGAPSTAGGGGKGVKIMRDRAVLAGGTFDVKSCAEHGTSVSATIPLRADARHELGIETNDAETVDAEKVHTLEEAWPI